MSRRFRRRPHGSLLLLGGAAILLLGRVLYDRLAFDVPTTAGMAASPTLAAPLVAGPCRILGVVDCQTLLIEQEPASHSPRRVRLLGILPPKAARWQAEAGQFVQQFSTRGDARLELDKRRVDREGESLAYVYIEEVSLGEELVRAGLALPENYPGDNQTVARQMFRAQDEARRASRGIWSQLDSSEASR